MKPEITILVIDDELGTRKSIQAIFGEVYRVYPARDGYEGLKILRKREIDLIILDIKLPRADGIEVLKKIKAENSTLPIILLTGHASLSSAQKAIRWGASDYLTKPFDVEKLREVVNSALRKRAEERKKEEEVRENKQKLRAQYQHIPIPTYTWKKVGDDFILADYNEATIAITDGKVEGYRGMKVSEIHRDDPRIPEMISRCYASRKSILQEMEYTLKSIGETKYLAVKYVFVPPDLVMAHTEDITQRKQGELLLQESEERYRSLVRGIVDAVILVDINGKILMANDMALVTLGKPESRIVNCNLIEALPAKAGKALSAAVKKVVKTKKPTIHVDWVNQHYLELVVAPTSNQAGEVSSVTIVGRDLSERKLVETSLQEAFSIINRSPSVAFTWRNSEGWPVEFVSETVKTLFGYTPEEFTSGSVSYAATIHPDDLERVTREVAAYSREKGRKKFTHEPYRIVTKAGKVRWVEDWTFVTRDKSGKIARYKGLVTDVTERKKAEEILEKYREIFDNANDVIVYVDKRGILLDVNRKAADLFGYKKSDVVGKHFTELGVVGAKDLPKIVKIFRSVVRGGKHIPMMEMAATDRKGRKLFIEVSTRLLKEKGRLKGFLSIIRDITERKQTEQSLRESENRFRELADALPEIVFEIDREGNITFVNKIAFKVFGYTRSDLNKGLNARQILAPESRDRGMENIRKILGGKEVGPNEYLARKKDGSTFPVIVHSKAIIDGEEISGLRGVVIDITARKKAEKSARFKKLAETLIRVQEEERKRIARELHDEIGQDLTAIKLTLGMIKKDYPRLNQPLRKELQEASKLVDMTMTNVRRISTRMRPEALDELGLIPCLRHEIKTTSGRSGIRIELESGNFKGRTTPQKETIIYRIVQESLTNIIKHSRASEAGVRLSKGKRAINLKIRDNGRGFDTASLSNSRGLGILGMNERLVSVNGELKIGSAPGKGTVLEIQIPV